MGPPQPEALYNQAATGFLTALLHPRGKTEVEGRFMLELANTFLLGSALSRLPPHFTGHEAARDGQETQHG